MKKGFVAIASAVALAATSLLGSAVAGIGPSRGLPIVNVTTLPATDMYTVADTAVPGVQGSVMCVACHTRNPAKRTAYNSSNGGTTYNGSHFVTANFADTSEGGGYADGSAPKTRAARSATPLYMAGSTAARANGGQWAGAPKYGTLAGAGDIGPNTNNPSGAVAQMICESCHNIVTNIGAAKLLEAGFANGGDNAAYTVPGTTVLAGIAGTTGGTLAAKLCVGCHGRMSADISAEYQYHPIGSTTWVGTHHHRNTGTANYYGTGTEAAPDNMAVINRAFYTPAVQMWGANYGELGAAQRNLTYNVATNKKMKAPVTTGQIAVNGGAGSTQVLCTNCHRAHNAATTAGATILMTSAPATAFGPTTTANAVAGMGVNTRLTHLTNTNPLCLNCHQ